MNNLWDVFISDRLEVARNLLLVDIRQGIDHGEYRDDDLIRPAGTTLPWVRLDELGELAEVILQPPAVEAVPEMPVVMAKEESESRGFESFALTDDDEDEADITRFEADADDEEDSAEALVVSAVPDVDSGGLQSLAFAVPAAPWGEAESDLEDEADDLVILEDDEEPEDKDEDEDEDEAVAEFTLSRSATDHVEELDLAAMVDVAFQLVLFFLVTATTILYKTLEVPKPNPDSAPAAVAQGRGRTLDDLQRDYIVVEIDATGAVMIDHEPASADPAAIIERLRAAVATTHRKMMLVSADYATPHKYAVMAYDAANEIGLQIKIAKPSATKS